MTVYVKRKQKNAILIKYPLLLVKFTVGLENSSRWYEISFIHSYFSGNSCCE